MKVLIQGMRRNGTTVLFDLFRADPRFACFYEPLAAAQAPCFGGGSGINEDVDYFENVRALRARILEAGRFGSDPQIFNHGAPRDPRLEFEPDCPEPVTAYLRAMLGEGSHVVLKFTRAASKIAYLHALAPEAHLFHIVRDPRQVAVSYLFGKNGKNRARYEGTDLFFERAVNRIGWNGAAFSEILLNLPEYRHLAGLPDYQRVLLLWKDGFERTWSAGRQEFGDRYCLIRHEDLASRPVEMLEGLYGRLGLDLPAAVREWAAGHLRPPRPVYRAADPRWREGYARTGLDRILEHTGYPMP